MGNEAVARLQAIHNLIVKHWELRSPGTKGGLFKRDIKIEEVDTSPYLRGIPRVRVVYSIYQSIMQELVLDEMAICNELVFH